MNAELGLDLGDHRDWHILKRIVFVNSNNMGYVDLPIDKSAALFGRNNAGKTASLRALKFFVLPEVNLSDISRKFSFTHKDGEYTTHQTFEHYFPSDRSYIICEGENPAGAYCQILHRNPRETFGYSRLFVPVPYAELEPFLFDRATGENGGMGTPLNPTFRELARDMKALGPVAINGRAELKAALYSRRSAANINTRFSMIPMSGPVTEAQVECLRAILNLAFDIGKHRLPGAFATLIDQDLSGGDQSIRVDLDEIQAEHAALLAQQDYLSRLAKYKDDWTTLESVHADFRRQHQDAQQRAGKALAGAMAIEQEANAAIRDIDQQAEPAKEKHEFLKKQRASIDGERSEVLGSVKDRRQRYEATRQQLDTYEEVRQQFAAVEGCETDDDIIGYLTRGSPDSLEGLRESQALLKDSKKLAQSVEAKNQQRSDLVDRRKALESVLKEEKLPTLSQVGADSASVLLSLNAAFGRVYAEVDEPARGRIEDFAGLFGQKDGSLTFLGATVPGVKRRDYPGVPSREDLKRELESLSSEIAALNKEIAEGAESLKATVADRHAKMAEIDKEIQQAQAEIAAIRAGESVRAQHAEAAENLRAGEAELESLSTQFDAINADYLAARDAAVAAEQALREAKDAKQEAAAARQLIEGQVTMAGGLLGNPETLVLTPPDEGVAKADLESVVDGINADLKSLRALSETAKQLTSTLARAGVKDIEDLELATLDIMTPEFTRAFEIYQSEFSNLPELQRKLRSDVETHNHATSTQMELIQRMERAVSAFADSVNAELAGVRISNLQSVKVIIKVDERFQQLCADLKRFDRPTATAQLASTDFYNQLQAFCQEFLGTRGSSAKLDMTKVVTGVQFEYTINGLTTRKEQSNGTESMISAILLSVLMTRLVPDDVRIGIPVVVDEVGKLDQANAHALVAALAARDFVMFAASPTPLAYLVKAIGASHSLSRYVLTDTPAQGDCYTIYINNVETLAPQAEPA